MKLHIVNEYAPLEAVLVHRPGDEIDRLTHDNMHAYLFEDIPFLDRMREEHDEFVDVMRERDIRVIYLDRLVADLLDNHPDAKKILIDQVCAAENIPALAEDLEDARQFPNELLLSSLFRGLTHGEYQEISGRPPLPGATARRFILRPIPNAYFSRDPAVIVGRAAISCKMHYAERVRETILTRAVMEYHPEFAGNPITYGGTDAPREDRPFTIEGGDVIVLNEEAALVGVSERTRSETIEMLARRAFEAGHVRRVYEIPIPSERTFMHLDTVFTIVDRGMVVWYPGVMEHVKEIFRFEPDGERGVARRTDSRSLEQVLSDEFDAPLTIVRTGGGDEHYARREQHTDGTNILAIAPRVACTYQRNTRTIKAMKEAGIEVIPVAGSELVRGLGGPRCMTMPLRRGSP